MSVAITGKYLGTKKVELCHIDSGSTIVTDAPRDNSGDGSKFSPTDLIAAGLGACVMTTIAIVAERGGISVNGMHMSVEKHMSQEPRRIGYLPLTVHLPETLLPHERQKIERAGLSCPVHHSLHPEVRMEIHFQYDVKTAA